MNTFLKKSALVFCLCIPFAVQAQDENDIVQFLNAGKHDAKELMGAYLNPVIEGLSYGSNGGWYSTAKTHKTLGFDLGVNVHAIFVPSSKNYFNPNDLNLEAITGYTSSAKNGLAPTIVGPGDQTTYTFDANNDGQTDGQFNGPRGLDFKENIKISGVLAPSIQLGIGVYKNTDLKIRWMPEVEYGSSNIKLFGIGVMHDIKQHIPGIKILPFDLSVLVAFTNIKGSTGLDGTFNKPTNDTRAQQLEYDMKGWLFQALISKKLAIVTFYGGIGYNTIKTDADVTGSYIIPGTGTLKDPVSMPFKNKSARVSAGMRLNFGPVYLSGEYTLQEYSMVSIGLGVSIREVKIY